MSSGAYYRSWMDKPHLDPNTNLLTKEYVQGIGEFMRLVQQQPDAKSAPAAPPAAAQQDPGVMPVELLVQQPGREHLPVLQPNPRRGHSTWSINQMMYSMFRFGYSKWSVILSDERELWFRQFADLVIKGVVDLVEVEIASQFQPLSNDGDSTGVSTNLSLLQINEMVEKAVYKSKGGRLVGSDGGDVCMCRWLISGEALMT
ncbi:hypothetical protein DY000_02034327 [Brassica cretica]|uniref:Uncharacterized protein n=1 Tax=Brassica cretica TaxID=69181 RepID=A0ABQ7DGI5_BRACR|nr:hypothetical protein DY000_02034327 [Brassica cretica]